MAKVVQRWVQWLQQYANRWWYAPAIGVLAALDSFIVVVPTDGLLVSASMLAPKRWFTTALILTLGSTIGAWALALVLETHGLPFLLNIVPGVNETRAWAWTDHMIDQWGAIGLFLVALSPIMQHPAVALAALANMPLTKIFLIVFAGRLLKYLFLSWVSSHTPALLNRLWGIGGELKEVGIRPGGAPDPQK